MIRYTLLDTETTGLNGYCIQLAYKKFEDGKLVKELDEMFLPPAPIEPDAERVHGISMDMLKEKPPILSLNPEFQEHLDKTIVIAHNAQFDVSILTRDGFKIPFSICTCKLARFYFAELGRHNLPFLRQALRLEEDEKSREAKAHSAMGDVIILEKLFERIVARAMEREPSLGAKDMFAKFCNISRR